MAEALLINPFDQELDRTPGSFIEEKEFSLVWHFRSIEPEFADWLATELVTMNARRNRITPCIEGTKSSR
jgi:trehalose-6-phosphatase